MKQNWKYHRGDLYMADLSPVCGSERRPSGDRDSEQHRKSIFTDFDCGCCHGSKSEEGRSADPLSAPE